MICNKNWNAKCNLGSGSKAGKRGYHVKIDWSRTRHGGKWYKPNFTSIVLSEKTPDLLDSGRVKVESAVKEKTLTMSQQILQHTFGIHTPLGIATAHYLFNHTHSKSLNTLNNRLAHGIRSCSRWKKLVCTFHKACLTTGRCHTSLQWTIQIARKRNKRVVAAMRQ